MTNKLASVDIAIAAATPLDMPLPTATEMTTTDIVGRASRIAVSDVLDGTKVHNNAIDQSTQIETVEQTPVNEAIW